MPTQKRGRKKRRGDPARDNCVPTIHPCQPSSAAIPTLTLLAPCIFDAASTHYVNRGVLAPSIHHQCNQSIEQATYESSPASTGNDVAPDSQLQTIICNLDNIINEDDCSLSLTSLVTKCSNVFFDSLYPLMPIIHRPSINAAISQVNSQNLQKEAPLLALLTSLCAVTIAILPKDIFEATAEIAGGFYRASREALNTYVAEDLENPNSTSIAIRYLHTEYNHTIGNLRSSWHSLGEAIRICQAMRLHDKSSYDHMDNLESELCRRIFRLLFVADKSASILGNHPVVMGKFSLDGGITVLHPRSLGEVDYITSSELDPEDSHLDLLTGFNLNYELWRGVYNLLLEIELLRERFLVHPVLTSTQKYSTLADVSRLTESYLDFQASLNTLPSYLQAHPTIFNSASGLDFEHESGKDRSMKVLAIQRANLHISFHCLRMVVLHAMPALADPMNQLWSGHPQDSTSTTEIDPIVFESAKENHMRGGESSALLLQKLNIAESMLHIVCSCTLDHLRINGESCVSKIRLVGATMLELIDNHPNSPLVGVARKFRDSYPRILARLDSKTSDSVYEKR